MAKFKEGDLICRIGESEQKKVKGVLHNAYVFDDNCVLLFEDEDKWKLCPMPAPTTSHNEQSRAEKYIKDYTRNCSNISAVQSSSETPYIPWLTPEQALRAVEIAREELIDKLRKWIASKNERDSFTFGYIDRHFDKLLKQAMKGE